MAAADTWHDFEIEIDLGFDTEPEASFDVEIEDDESWEEDETWEEAWSEDAVERAPEDDEGPNCVNEAWLVPLDEPVDGASGGATADLMAGEPGVHSWEAHLAGVTGAALDPVHLYLRSTLSKEELALPEAEACAAAVLKARCDHQFWRPLIPAGLDGTFHGHFKDLRACQKLLEDHRPPASCPHLQQAWLNAVRLVTDAFPARAV